MTGTRTRARVRAPELVGRGGWINTGDRRVRLADLRGKLVLLDFWTFCCINCLHVLDELRDVERDFADVLVVLGVHSPKFEHEADHGAVRAAVERYEVHHPVLDDPDLTTWSAYAVKAWPTLTLVDPEGYVVAQLAGEGHAHALRRLLEDLVAEHEARGTLHRGAGPYVPPPPAATELRFPASVLPLPDGTLLVADTGNHSLVQLADDGESVLRRIGTGHRGQADGPAELACFAEPQGLCLLPPAVAGPAGYDVVVADTANHLLRGLVLDTGEVRTVAGTGRQWMQGSPTSGPGELVDLSSPWDVAWYDGQVVVAMAGIHQLWSSDPRTGSLGVLAGTTNEGLRDGPAPEAWFAQPSGLAVDADVLWVADAETSALRRVRPDPGAPSAYRVETVVGSGLFDFGHRDGAAAQALLQHPLGVAVLPDGSVAVLDTYNGAVRRYDPASEQVSTLVTGLAEPSDGAVTADGLVVVESAAHRLSRVRLPDRALTVPASAHATPRPVTDVAPAAVHLDVVFEPPPGQQLDERYGPATRLVVTATPPELIASGAGAGPGLTRELRLSTMVGSGVLHVAARAAACDVGGAHAACHIAQQDWGVPVRVTDDGAARLGLVLLGLDA